MLNGQDEAVPCRQQCDSNWLDRKQLVKGDLKRYVSEKEDLHSTGGYCVEGARGVLKHKSCSAAVWKKLVIPPYADALDEKKFQDSTWVKLARNSWSRHRQCHSICSRGQGKGAVAKGYSWWC